MGRQQPAGGPPHRAVCFVEAQMISELNQRSRDIFRTIVDAYVETGEPIGSRTISRRLGICAVASHHPQRHGGSGRAWACSIRPHTSAGRLPTEAGLRLFVHGLLEVGALSEQERENIDVKCATSNRSVPEVLAEASSMLSGLSSCAGLVLAPKTDRTLKHIEFVNLGPGRALVVLVTEDGLVENRVHRRAAGHAGLHPDRRRRTS